MHGSSLTRMAWFVQTFLATTPEAQMSVLDIGSMDVAGGTYRQFFDSNHFTYKGLDLAPGPNVDIIPKLPYHWPEISDNSYDVVISGQALEHMEFFWLAAAEMARVLRPGGLMCIIAPRGFGRHRHPVDCYRFDADGMLAVARYCNLMPMHVSTDMAPCDADGSWHIEACEDSLLVARKPDPWPGIVQPRQYEFAQADMDALAAPMFPCPPLPKPSTVPQCEYDKLNGELVQLKETLASLRQEYDRQNAQIGHLQKLLDGYEKSKSWRVTRPLRFLGHLFRRITDDKRPNK